MGATIITAPAAATYPAKYVGRFGPVGSSVFTKRGTSDGKTEVTTVIAGSSSYATGGDSISLSSVGLAHVTQASVIVDSAITAASGLASGFAPKIDISTDTAPKLVLYSNGAQVANGTDVSAHEYLVKLVGY